MSFKKITAVFDELRLDVIEKALESHGVSGFSIHAVKGRGSYFNAFNRDHLVNHLQMEIYTNQEHANAIAELVMNAASVDTEGEGLVAITPVDGLFRIHGKKAAKADEFKYFEVDHG